MQSYLLLIQMDCDGKEIKDMKEIDSNVADDLHPWHFKKLEMGYFKEHCTNTIKCIKESKKESIPGDSKEVQNWKIMH